MINKRTYQELTCINQIEIVKGVSYLFEVPGTLEQIAELSATWLYQCLSLRLADSVNNLPINISLSNGS